MTACLLAGGVALAVAHGFTLGWTHSVEHSEWREAWAVTPATADAPATLTLTEARIRGSGAGMEPGEDAVRRDGWWVWNPARSVASVTLAASGATGGGWRLCTDSGCRTLGERAGPPVTLAPCPSGMTGD